MNPTVTLPALFLLTSCIPVCADDLNLPAVFSDHAVLQRNKPVKIWGTAAPESDVTVSFHDQSQTARSDDDGHWSLHLDAMSVHRTGRDLVVRSGDETVTLTDIVVGEVWLCSGQSNMAWTLNKCVDAESEIAAATDDLIRVNLSSGSQTWQVCHQAKVAASTSGVAYFFAQQLRTDHPEVPVGLIVRAVGGTPIEFWTPVAALQTVDFAQQAIRTYSLESETGKAIYEHLKAEAAWKRKARKDGRRAAGKKPESGLTPEQIVLAGVYGGAGKLWRERLLPVAGYTISGALWYQGERNSKTGAENAAAYAELLPAMITSWRKAWDQGDFRFLAVQLPAFAGGSPNWAVVQKGQAAGVRKVPNADYVDIRDLPDGGLHPKDKKPVGQRLAAKAFIAE